MKNSWDSLAFNQLVWARSHPSGSSNTNQMRSVASSAPSTSDSWPKTPLPLMHSMRLLCMFPPLRHSPRRVANQPTIHRAAGGKCNGPPGPRPQYTKTYYGAFVHDLDGNNLEAMFIDCNYEAELSEACTAAKEQS